MTEDRSPRLALPLLQPGQAQKEADHNGALALLDLAVQAAVVAIGVDTPPSAPDEGECWIVGASPVGDWVGHAGAIAGWTAGGWRFLAPREGMSTWSHADSATAQFRGGAWSVGEVAALHLVVEGVAVIGAQQGAIAVPAGGATIDAEARSAITSILGAMRAHGLIAL